ncbi:MAG: hypothetical protein IJU36_06035 [Paludibacteraceae bacterium]|nr:hypothetical protein [Paludibacteraceae bacterium]
MKPTPSYRRYPRTQRLSILLNEKEAELVNRYCKRYGISNRSRLIRETLMRAILKQLDRDNPTLFD